MRDTVICQVHINLSDQWSDYWWNWRLSKYELSGSRNSANSPIAPDGSMWKSWHRRENHNEIKADEVALMFLRSCTNSHQWLSRFLTSNIKRIESSSSRWDLWPVGKRQTNTKHTEHHQGITETHRAAINSSTNKDYVSLLETWDT